LVVHPDHRHALIFQKTGYEARYCASPIGSLAAGMPR
jgi:hypothetical protein